MRKGISRLLATVLIFVIACGMLTGCGIVKVVKIGQEGALTGETEFDSSSQGSADWDEVVKELTDNAKDFGDAVKDMGTDPVAVSGTAKIKEYNHEKTKTFLELDGFDTEVQVQTGTVYTGTAIRDLQTGKTFSDFKNQTEWSEYAKSLNAESDQNVIQKLGLDDKVAGKELKFVGAAQKKAGKVVITLVSGEIS